MALRARFIPRFPEKYAGDPAKIFARSSWELYVMKFLDASPAVIKWGSEELKIPYLKPFIDASGQARARPAYYFPDFVVIYRNKAGEIRKEILEVKPLKESSTAAVKTTHDQLSLAVNVAKWTAAENFAKKNGMSFRVLTERALFRRPAKAGAKRQRPRRASKKTQQLREGR